MEDKSNFLIFGLVIIISVSVSFSNLLYEELGIVRVKSMSVLGWEES